MTPRDLDDSSSSQPLHDSQDSFTSNGSDANSFTFLVSDSRDPNFSHDDLSQRVDKFAHTRTRRKRTRQESLVPSNCHISNIGPNSPKDYTILEAEYQRNSKPDKATRDSLVGRVSLSEKEIQVWFQNRRQMTRRKRNTWQPNEITSIIRSSQDSGTDFKSSTGDLSSSQQSPIDPPAPNAGEDMGDKLGIKTQLEDAVREGSPESTDNDIEKHNARVEESLSQLTNTSESSAEDTSLVAGSSENLSQDDIEDPTVHPANGSGASDTVDARNSADSSISTFKQADSVPAPPKKFNRTSSMVRLSMSLDGKASVVLKGNTPSPPSKQPRGPIARSGLQRSQSLLPRSTQPASSSVDLQPTLPVPRVHGRSRDARTWEFYCDTDVRESLDKTADHGQRGSAAAPIPLIRSGSTGRQPLASSTKIQNTQLPRPSSKRKAEAGEKRKPKLARTASSHARLQSTKETEPTKVSGSDEKSCTQPALWKDPLGDSDKENWEPGTQSSNPRPRSSGSRTFAVPKRKVLQENNSVPSHSSSLGNLMEREKRNAKHTPKDANGENDVEKENDRNEDEVSAFMRGSGSGRSEDDMDAVQNLLSLSQGAWE